MFDCFTIIINIKYGSLGGWWRGPVAPRKSPHYFNTGTNLRCTEILCLEIVKLISWGGGALQLRFSISNSSECVYFKQRTTTWTIWQPLLCLCPLWCFSEPVLMSYWLFCYSADVCNLRITSVLR